MGIIILIGFCAIVYGIGVLCTPRRMIDEPEFKELKKNIERDRLQEINRINNKNKK